MNNSRFNFILLILILFFYFPQNSISQVTEEWVARYPGGASDIALDSNGNIYIGGSCYNTTTDYCVLKYDMDGNKVWDASYDSETQFAADDLQAIAVDSFGNVYATGGISVSGIVVYDYATVKFDQNGNLLWVARYDGGNSADDWASAICTDLNGNVYVTGGSGYAFTSDPDYATIKYDTNGNEVWVARYKGPDNSEDRAYAISVDENDNVYVTGSSSNNVTWISNMVTIKYNADGGEQWVAVDSARIGQDMVLDSDGNIYITGEGYWQPSGNYHPMITIKYDPNGNTNWKARYYIDNSGSFSIHKGIAISLDSLENVYVTGSSWDNDTWGDIATIKYDENGNQLWVNRYNGPGDNSDEPVDLKVDELGNVYVTGKSRSGGEQSPFDYLTVKYDTEGNLIWVARYDGTGNGDDYASALGLDAAGNVYVTGTSMGSTTNFDFATIKYVQAPVPLAPTLVSPSDGAIIESDMVNFNWRQNGDPVNNYWIEVSTDSLMTNSTIDSTILDTTTVMSGFIHNTTYYWRVKAKNVAGWGSFSEVRDFQIVTTSVKTEADIPKEYALYQNYPNPFNPSTQIEYNVKEPCKVILVVYNLNGQVIKELINSYKQPGKYSINLDMQDIPSGIYFYKIQMGDFQAVKKMLKIE
ncbi:SBBP repeat-containing protein [candidate division KSB1 bacterium]|nr:SBBP repeat-containing protein [candidate division KSB1 bacterium]